MSVLLDLMLASAYAERSRREVHSADGQTYIDRVDLAPKCKRRGPVWLAVVNGKPLATFLRREDCRDYIRNLKFLMSRYGREVGL